MNMKQAVCLLYPSGDGRFFSVSRRNNITKWGLPGGKVDPGEDVIEAIVREVQEEIGIHIDPSRLVPLYAGTCAGGGTFWVTTFLYQDVFVHGTDTMEEGLCGASLSRSDLETEDISTFADYNRRMFRAMDERVNACLDTHC